MDLATPQEKAIRLVTKTRKPRSAETREKIAKALRGKRKSKTTLKKMAESQKAVWSKKSSKERSEWGKGISAGRRALIETPLIPVRPPTQSEERHRPEAVTFVLPPQSTRRRLVLKLEPDYYDDMVGRILKAMPVRGYGDPWVGGKPQWLIWEINEDECNSTCHGYRTLRDPRDDGPGSHRGWVNVGGGFRRVEEITFEICCIDGRKVTTSAMSLI